MARAPVEPGEPIKSLKTIPPPIAIVIAAWIPPRARTVKHFECPNSVTLVYYLGTCLAAERCAAVPHRAMPAACCGYLRGQTPERRLYHVVVPIGHAGSRKHGPRHYEQWPKRLPREICCWPRGLPGPPAASRLRAGGAAVGLPWSIQRAGRGREIGFHHGGPVGRLYPASSHPPRSGAARLRHRGSRQITPAESTQWKS